MTNEQKIRLIRGLQTLKIGEWYNIHGRPDYDDLIEIIAFLSERLGLRYRLSDDKKQVCYYDDYYTVQCIEEGHREEIEGAKGKKIWVTHEKSSIWKRGEQYRPSYRVYRGDKLVSIDI